MITFDLGSNTLRIASFTCEPFERTVIFERIIRTAKDLHISGKISDASIKRLFLALEEASELFDFKKEPCYAVTTQAMRVASNASEIVSMIKKRFGITFEIISGEKEAYLTALAVEHALKREGVDPHNYVLFDLGGGSTEITFCHQSIRTSRSFPFGIVTTAETYKESIETHIETLATQIEPFIQAQGTFKSNILPLVTTAGTPTTVAAFLEGLDYAHYDADRINGKILYLHDFETAFQTLTSMEPEEAERFTGTNRRDLVIVGILLVQSIMKKLGFDRTIVIDDGLREGIAIANCNRSALSKENA